MEELSVTKSQCEREIFNGCLSLLRELEFEFNDLLDILDIELEEKVKINFPYSHIVNKLFLYTTDHSGHTSTIAKCKELGLDWGANATFSFGEDEEDED